MKILHVYKDYFPVAGGIENHIRALAEAQAARGHDVAVLVHSRDAHTHVEQMNGVRVLFAARWLTVSSTPLGPALPRLLARERPDIAHLHFPYPWGEVSQHFVGHARGTVITYHSDIVRQVYMRVLYRPLMYRILSHVNRIIATSPDYVRSSPILSRLVDKCTVIPHGIDPAPFEHPDLQAAVAIRARAGAEPLLLFVGQLRYYKGLEYLLHALCDLPTARLIVVGTGPMGERWRELAHALGLDARVIFAGAVPDAELPAYYAAADIFVLPASERSEAFGLVQLEAMAAGKPVVSTQVGTGTSFVNLDGLTGRVVPARDPHALAAALAALARNPAQREKMGATGRARVHDEFTLDRMVQRVLGLYQQLL